MRRRKREQENEYDPIPDRRDYFQYCCDYRFFFGVDRSLRQNFGAALAGKRGRLGIACRVHRGDSDRIRCL
jgi:hypothetical protein